MCSTAWQEKSRHMPGGGVSDYATIHARVRATYADMLDAEIWPQLCDAQSYAALIETLKTTVYGPYLNAVQDQDLTSRRAVYQIKGHLADKFAQIIRFVPGSARPLITQLYRLYEVDNLKALLRGIASGVAWEQVRYVLFPLGAFTVLPAEGMAGEESVPAAVERLRGTPYWDTLSHAMERFHAEQSLFPLEVALDLNYWREMWRDVNALARTDRAQAKRLVGSLLDTNNLMWAIRYRVYHHLSEEEIINYTLPFGYRLHDRDIRAIAAGAEIAPVVRRVFPALADPGPLLQEPRSGLPDLERRLQQYLVRECRLAFTGYPFHVGVPLAYLLLSELEIQDLTVLVEAKALGVPAERYRSHLAIGCPLES
jgi:V/A-type H+-transporting ATPase subunit C